MCDCFTLPHSEAIHRIIALYVKEKSCIGNAHHLTVVLLIVGKDIVHNKATTSSLAPIQSKNNWKEFQLDRETLVSVIKAEELSMSSCYLLIYWGEWRVLNHLKSQW